MDFKKTLLFSRIHDHGPRIGNADIRAWEEELQATLPEDYKSFLLYCNGGYYYEDNIVFESDVDEENEFYVSVYFYGLNYIYNQRIADLREMTECYRGRIPQGMVPIATTDVGPMMLNLSESGGIYLWYREDELNVSPDENQVFFADSFTALAKCCHPRCFEDDYTIENEEPFLSIESYNLPKLICYLDDGFPICSTNERGQTLLYVACWKLDFEGAAELLRRGADPDDGDHKTGRSPLWVAAYKEAVDLTRILFKFGASPMMGMRRNVSILDDLEPITASDYIRSVFAEASNAG